VKLVLLPGLDGTGDLFQPFISCLSPEIDAQVISYSTDKKQNYSELTQHVIEQLPQDDFVLIAESFSGYIAFQIALKNIPHLKRIIFVASFLEPPKPLLLTLSRCLPMSILFSLPIPTFMVKYFLIGMQASHVLIKEVKNVIKKVQPEVLSHRLGLIKELKIDKTMIPKQVYYIQADNDKLVPDSCLSAFNNNFSFVRLYKVKGPHFLLQAQPKACAKIINESLVRIINETFA